MFCIFKGGGRTKKFEQQRQETTEDWKRTNYTCVETLEFRADFFTVAECNTVAKNLQKKIISFRKNSFKKKNSFQSKNNFLKY